jgi:hypothetical protein
MGGIQRPVSVALWVSCFRINMPAVANSSSDKTQKENFQPVDGEEVLEKFAALSYQAGTSRATILRSFATMVRWRKTSLRPSATTA